MKEYKVTRDENGVINVHVDFRMEQLDALLSAWEKPFDYTAIIDALKGEQKSHEEETT